MQCLKAKLSGTNACYEQHTRQTTIAWHGQLCTIIIAFWYHLHFTSSYVFRVRREALLSCSQNMTPIKMHQELGMYRHAYYILIASNVLICDH